VAKTTIRHDFDCSESAFWQASFFDDEFNRRLYLETLKFPVWRVLEQKVSDVSMERRVEIQPFVENLPVAIKKVVGDRLGYIEEGRLDRTANRYRFRVIPAAAPEKTDISGEIWTEALGPGRVRRLVDFEVEVRILIVGKLIEQKTIDDTRAIYDKIANFLRSYLREKGLSTPEK
jgi:hypothetical protein